MTSGVEMESRLGAVEVALARLQAEFTALQQAQLNGFAESRADRKQLSDQMAALGEKLERVIREKQISDYESFQRRLTEREQEILLLKSERDKRGGLHWITHVLVPILSVVMLLSACGGIFWACWVYLVKAAH